MRHRLSILFTILLAIFLLPFVIASVTCTTYSISATSDYGIIPSSQNITCSNSDVNNSVVLTQLGSFFSTNPSPVIIGAGEANKQIQISFSLQNVGTYTGYLSNMSNPITITQIVNQPSQSQGCFIDIFPTVLTNIKIKRGETKTRNIQFTLPSCFLNYVTIQGISLQSDEQPIQLGEISIGKVMPGNSVMIPIEINSESASTGTYSDTLQFLVYNSSGSKINLPSVSISVIVTSSISPVSNFTFTDLPSCSLDATEISVNDSHRLTCSITNANFQVRPVIDSKFIRGISVSETSNQFIYEFRANTIGLTTIKAEFLYKNAPIGTPFSQDLRISYSGSSPISGTKMDFNFYQLGSKKTKENLVADSVTVLVIDNSTQSLVPSFTLYLNGQPTNNTFTLEADKTYELRASSSGYIDGVSILKVQEVPLSLIIDPIKDYYELGEKINVTSSPEGATIMLDNSVVASPFAISSEGVHTIKIVKAGYISAEKNVTVKTIITVTDTSIPFQDWKVGNTIVLRLSKPSKWVVTRDGVQIASNISDSDIVKFKIDKVGMYSGTAGDSVFMSKSIEKKPFFSFMPDWWTIWHTIVIVVIVIVIIWLIRLGKKEEEGGIGMSVTPRLGV